MPMKVDLSFFLSSTTTFIDTHIRMCMCTYAQVSNKQESIEVLNSSSACSCFELTCMFQLLLGMFPENNSFSQGSNANVVFVPGLVRIAIFALSEPVSFFKLSPLMLQVGRHPCLQCWAGSAKWKGGKWINSLLAGFRVGLLLPSPRSQQWEVLEDIKDCSLIFWW